MGVSMWMVQETGLSLDEIEAAYRGHATRFLRVARAITGNDEDAQDAVQEGIAGAVRARASFRGEGSIEGWLWSAVVNAARSQHRRERTLPLVRLEGGISLGFAEAYALERRVRAALARLTERQRLILFLRYYAELDHATIATVLDVAPGTVAATVSQGQARLRALLEGMER